MKRFKNFNEIPEGEHTIRCVVRLWDAVGGEFEKTLGGDLFLVEHIEDLNGIFPADSLPIPMGEMRVVCKFNNNSGGPTYFIPIEKLKKDKLGHITRSSDSSLYDEVCVLCNRTDGTPGLGIDLPCPVQTDIQ